MSSFEVKPMFAVPFGQDRLADADGLNTELKHLMLAREAEGRRYANPNPSLQQQQGVFESNFDLFSWPDPCVQRLRRFCLEALGRTVASVNGYDAPTMAKIRIFSHSWFHVTRHGGFTILHTHPMASWSGVYCVAPGEMPEARPESGILRFHNPHHYSNVFLDPGNSHFKAPYHHGTWNFQLQAGHIVLFPSWLQHEVMPFFGRDERITVAFNCWFHLPDEPLTAP
jgi:hypothetical protein